MTRRILITIEYDGGPFSGWQRQDNADSVQARIEDAAAAFYWHQLRLPAQGAPIQAFMLPRRQRILTFPINSPPTG